MTFKKKDDEFLLFAEKETFIALMRKRETFIRKFENLSTHQMKKSVVLRVWKL